MPGMINFSTWDRRELPVTSLHLDPVNPRLAPSEKARDTRELVAELVAHENVDDIARSIVERGVFPNEFMIGVVDDDERTVIIEGNRRLAALKILLSPGLAPESRQKFFGALSARVDPKLIRQVTVVIAPSRELAAPLIVSKHTDPGTKGWGPTQQARYIASLTRDDLSVDELARLLGMDKTALAKNLRIDALYKIACALDLPETELAVVRNPREFNFSAFERLMENSLVQTLLGLDFDDRLQPRVTIKDAEFKKTMRRLVSDVATGKQDTRSLNNRDNIETYLKALGDDAPDQTPVEPHDPGPKPPPPPASPPTGGARKKAVKVAKLGPTIVPRGIKSGLKHPRINAVFAELRKLKLAETPNAVVVMLRVFLEMLVANYLSTTKKDKPLLDAMDKHKKKDDHYPTLRQMLDLLLNQDKEFSSQIPRQQLTPLRKMISNHEHALSLDEIDQFVHNRHAAPTEHQLRMFWVQLEPLIEMLLVEPPKPEPVKPSKPVKNS
jgi:hypothetical protein